LDSFREKGFPPGRPWTPSGPSLGPGRLRPLCRGRGQSPLFPFLAWSCIPPSSADFGTCVGNHSASIFQVYPFAVVQWGLLHLLGESTPAPEAAGWTTVIVHVAMHLLEMRPIKYVLGGGLLILFSLQLLHLHLYRSVALLQGGFLAQSHEEGINCPLGAYGVDAFSGCLSPSGILRAEPKLQPRSFPSLPTRRLTLQESAPILSYRWWAGACHLRVSLPLERE
jgi:hypothetical protein